jgi:hypothetical protein
MHKQWLGPIAAAAMSVVAFPSLADPSGTYDIDGMNPDGSTYQASVLVSKVGDTFSVTYSLDDRKVMGTAIGDDDVLAIGYGEADDSGVALMYRDGKRWQGVWSYLGAKQLGTEEWQPR